MAASAMPSSHDHKEEMFYLILKYLKSFDALKDSAHELEDKMVSAHYIKPNMTNFIDFTSILCLEIYWSIWYDYWLGWLRETCNHIRF